MFVLILFLILAAMVSKSAKGLIGAMMSLMVALILMTASCAMH